MTFTDVTKMSDFLPPTLQPTCGPVSTRLLLWLIEGVDRTMSGPFTLLGLLVAHPGPLVFDALLKLPHCPDLVSNLHLPCLFISGQFSPCR